MNPLHHHARFQKKPHGIKSWAEDDRPREKLVLKGASALSDAELLAILIQSGTQQQSALDLARMILAEARFNLQELGKFNANKLMRIRGIGQAKAITLLAALELGRRRHAGSPLDHPVIHSSADAARLLRPLLADSDHERFAVLFMNMGNKVLHCEILSEGGITGTVADPRLILRKALEYDATRLILCHNHPSGTLMASEADEKMTEKIIEVAIMMDIHVLDHIIVAQTGYFSFADKGLL